MATRLHPSGTKVLAAAVLVHAMRAARKDAYAANWLHSDDALFWVRVMGVEPGYWRAMLARHNPGEIRLPTAPQLLALLPELMT